MKDFLLGFAVTLIVLVILDAEDIELSNVLS